MNAYLRSLVTAAAMAGITALHGQSVGPAGNAVQPNAAQQLANYRSAMAQAHDLATRKSYQAVEQAVTPLNHAKPNTAQWHIETAQRILQVAEQLARENRTADTAALIGAVLQHLTTADALATTPQKHADAKALTGFVQEYYLGDAASALASYQAAAQQNPKSPRAAEAVDRLQRTLNGLQAKHGGS